MARMKEALMGLGTLACALGIGFAMQSTEAASNRYGATGKETVEAPVPQIARTVPPDRDQVTVIDLQEVMLTSAMPSLTTRGPETAARVESPEPPVQPAPLAKAASADEAQIPDKCEMTAKASATADAQALLELAAPCHADQFVTIHHNGMFFSDKTDADGKLARRVPGLSEQAVFIFAFPDGEGAVAQTMLPDLASLERVVLQWSGRGGFELHARAFGAPYGAEGHVWHGAEGAATQGGLVDGTGGHMTRLGRMEADAPHMADVYTYPANMSGSSGQIDLSVEAEITAENCGLEIEAELHEHDRGHKLRTRNVSFAVPGCETIGGYLVLNNVFDDMKVAAR